MIDYIRIAQTVYSECRGRDDADPISIEDLAKIIQKCVESAESEELRDGIANG